MRRTEERFQLENLAGPDAHAVYYASLCLPTSTVDHLRVEHADEQKPLSRPSRI